VIAHRTIDFECQESVANGIDPIGESTPLIDLEFSNVDDPAPLAGL
jgi:hypothetical protein